MTRKRSPLCDFIKVTVSCLHMHDSTNRSPSTSAASTQPTRTFVDADSVRWQVFERAFADYDRRTGLSLIFASESAVRRVRDYPENWQALSDEQLAELSWKS
ncbi:MAG: hypothetical protein JWM95_360 [Gemmatimonadetes bacterium]|nr:hypothetical protein [Gemmatimonadota bacterium]